MMFPIPDENIGFSLNPFKKKHGKKRPQIQRPSITSSPLSVGAKRQALGFGAHTFAAGGATEFQMTALPQVPFRVDRLVIIVTRTAGAAGIGCLVNDVRVGTKSQFAGTASLPAEMFAVNAIGMALKGDTAQPGNTITIDVAVTAAPGGADTVIVQPSIMGDALA